MRVLFRVAAGPRLGFGHLVRCRSLARALGTPPTVSVRGSLATRRTAAQRGWDVRDEGLALLNHPGAPDVLVVDDPTTAEVTRWVAAARRRRIPVATIHDLGLGCVASDLAVDGSIDPRRGAPAALLSGPLFAMLDPAVARERERGADHTTGVVLVALGGGAHVQRFGSALVPALAAALPDRPIRVVEGFVRSGRRRPPLPNVAWVSAPDGLAVELRRASIAVVAGGLTLYEAAALERPAVAAAVVPAQRQTIAAFARRGAAVDAGAVDDRDAARRIVDAVQQLASDPGRAHRLATTAARLVDGRGVFRVADAIRQLARARTEESHAA